MKVTVKFNNIKKTTTAMLSEVDDRLGELAFEGERYVKQSIDDSPASGRTYDRGAKSHTASSPGNPPRTDTGNLVNSIYTVQVKKMVWRIYTGAEYAVGLEYGTTKIKARPFMMPMAVWLKREVSKKFKRLS